MAATTPRMAIPYPTGSDTNNVPGDFQRLAVALDTIAAVYLEGTAATRPPAGEHGRFYFGTDNGRIYYDWGGGWITLNADTLTSTILAAGDLIIGSGPGAVTNLPVGAEGQALVSSAGLPNGIGWADVAGQPRKMTGALAAARFVGGTVQGAPTTGSFLAGDFVVDQTGNMWICYQAGSPGAWRPPFTPALGQPAPTDGAVSATRFVGGTSSGPPIIGTYFRGDFVIDQSAAVWVCVSGGTPGTWVGLVKHACYTSFQSVAQTILALVWADLRFDTVVIDTDQGHDRNNGRFYTCRRKGTYKISGSVAFPGFSASGGGVGCRITFNGDPVIGTANFDPVISIGFNTTPCHTVQLELNVGDIVAIQGWHPASSSQDTSVDQPDVRCRFNVEQLR